MKRTPRAETAVLAISPEFQGLISPPSAAELATLEASILDGGVRDALVVWLETGTLLDGHNRYAICKRHGIPFDTLEISLPDDQAARVWILRNQLGRRNLTDAQRVQLALKLEETLAPAAKERSEANLKRGKKRAVPDVQISARRERTVDTVAQLAGVSHDTVSKVKRVLASDDEEAKAAMLNGTASIHKADQIVRKKAKGEPKPRRLKSPEDGDDALQDLVEAFHRKALVIIERNPALKKRLLAKLNILAQRIELW